MATNTVNMERTAGSVVVRRVEDDICDIDPTSISRSICVTGFPTGTKSEALIIHFQRKKNGGGDIESITINKRGAAVITFDNPDVVTTVLQHEQQFEEVILTVEPYLDNMIKNDPHLEVFEVVSAELFVGFVEFLSRERTKTLLNEMSAKTGVQWIEASENFMISGTFKQVEESRAYLQQGVNQSNGIVVFSGLRGKDVPSHDHEKDESQLPDGAENEEDVNQNSPTVAATNVATHPRERANETQTGNLASASTSPEIQSFDVEPKIVKAFVKAYEKDLDAIESKYQVEIPRKAEGSKFSLKPKEKCSGEEYGGACDHFINLYQQKYQLIKMERFSLKSEKNVIHSREKIGKIGKNFPIYVEVGKDRKHWELYGEASQIEEALKFLEQERVEIQRETENAMDENGRRKKSKYDEEPMDFDPHESSRGARNPGNILETYLGKVKVSVYKGDITKEKVDVIVNAANGALQHDGGVAKAIADKGGRIIKEESRVIIRNRGTLKDGEAVATKSGNLPCKAVVHAVGPKWDEVGSPKSEKILRRACLSSFFETQKLNMSSIALPAIGSGMYGMPKDVCAEVMFDAVDEFVRQGDPKKKTITDIRLVNIDDPSVQAFRKEFITRYGENRETKTSGGGSASLSPTGAEGGSSTEPSSRSNRGKSRNKNGSHNSRSKKKQNDSGANQHQSTPFGSLEANVDHPLGVSGHSPSATFSYSGAVKKNTGDSDGRPPTGKDHRRGEGKGGFSLPLKEGDRVKTDKKEEDDCPICLDSMTNPRTLKCKHAFCSACLQTALDVSNKCPVCQEPQGALQGNQPRGEMTTHYARYSVPGYEGYDTIIIEYRFPSGIQGPKHPNPGQWYGSTSRTAYLPDTREGQEVLQLLRRAFAARLVFTVGTSSTTGLANQITWNDIHHKTSLSGGPFRFGYPDPDYLRRVKEELAAKGIR